MICVTIIYRDEYAEVQWSAARNEERLSFDERTADKLLRNDLRVKYSLCFAPQSDDVSLQRFAKICMFSCFRKL